MFKKYKWNFVFVVLIVSLIGFLIFDVILYYSIKSYLFRQTFDEMELKTKLAGELVEEKDLIPLSSSSEELHRSALQLKKIVESRVTIIDKNGEVLADSDVEQDAVALMDNHINRPEVQEAMTAGLGQSYRISDTVNRKLFYTALKISDQGTTVGFLRLAYYAQRFEETMRNILALIIPANIVGLLILSVASFYLGSVVTFPILRTVRIAEKISQGDLNRRFPVKRKDEIGRLSSILNQLTERLKNQINMISYESSKLENILTNLDIGIVAVDKDKKILHTNPEMFNILKLKPSDIRNQRINDIVHFEPLLDSLDATLKQKNQNHGEFYYYDETGKNFLSYIVSPFIYSNEKYPGALIQIQNITELKRLEAIRRNFVASASHELKTPLTSIVGYTETLLEGAVDSHEARVKFIRRIQDQTRRLEYLVKDLLKLSQLEQDIPLDMKPINLNPLLNNVIDEFKEKSDQKKIDIAIDAFDEKIMVQADDELIRTVFENLIDNALKYTPENGQIEIKLFPAEQKKDWLKIEVHDNGIGIEQKYHERIFQRFYRVDKARSRQLGGTGLGLSIVKHIVERHGSRIYVVSRPGQGSCFCFDLKMVGEIV